MVAGAKPDAAFTPLNQHPAEPATKPLSYIAGL
jgi:hypothetical protein